MFLMFVFVLINFCLQEEGDADIAHRPGADFTDHRIFHRKPDLDNAGHSVRSLVEYAERNECHD